MSDLTTPPPDGASTGDPVDTRPVLLEARGLKKTYRVGHQTLQVLRGVDMHVRQGEILAILGKSGCGKSTLLHVLGWLDSADEGRIVFDGVDRSTLASCSSSTTCCPNSRPSRTS